MLEDFKPNPDFTQVATALERKKPDRVPLAEAVPSRETMSRFLGKKVDKSDVKAHVEFWYKAGYDYIPLTVGMMEPGKVTQDSAISRVIKDVLLKNRGERDQDDAWNLEKRAFIHDAGDFKIFPWEEAAKLDLSAFYEVQKYLPEGMKIIALSGKIFTLTWMLMGFENFCLKLSLEPKLVQKVFERVAEIQFKALNEIVRIPNVAAVWAVDDLAFGGGPMISPRDLRKYVFPWYKKFGKMCHDHNLYFLFHSDGVLWDLMDDLIDLGIDGLHPIDPTCMDIERAKQEVGGKVCLIGNISNEILMNGTPEEVAELTKHRIRTIAPGGGYCLGSGNSVPEWAKIENFKAMIETTLKYGHYPITL